MGKNREDKNQAYKKLILNVKTNWLSFWAKRAKNGPKMGSFNRLVSTLIYLL